MNRSLISAAALAAALAGAPIAFAQSGAQTGALGTGGSTPNQTGAATATTPNVGPGYSQGTPVLPVSLPIPVCQQLRGPAT
jgi:hypothetical protein